jgi:nitrite reductase (NADH) small subunit
VSSGRWLDAGPVTAIPARGARVLETPDGPIALFRTSDDCVYALRDRCPHRGGPLSQGIVHGACVTCPLHDWVIELPTGTARSPDKGAVERFAVRIERGHVLVELGPLAVASIDVTFPLAQSA